MVGLPIDESHNSEASLVTKAAESELQARIRRLQQELNEATTALERLQGRGGGGGGSSTTKSSWDLSSSLLPRGGSSSSPRKFRGAPAGKKGYLFKWNDRSIGWSGVKWSLRFVTLDRGRLLYYGSHTDLHARYMLSLRGCAVREDGWKRNRRHPSWKKGEDPPIDEPGAYFFLFSIYQRTHENDDLDENDVVPLLRFSTPSLAEKNQWVALLSEACAYCETDEFLADEAMRDEELMLQQQQQAKMAMAMPEAKEGTLPPLIFASAFKPIAKRPSFSRKLSESKIFRTKSRNFNAEKVESRSLKGYAPSRPMHRSAAPSYLSLEAPTQNYRGLLNLGVIILLVSNFRLMLVTVQREGFVLKRFLNHHFRDLPAIRKDPWEEFPFVSGFLLQVVFVFLAYSIELALSRKKLSERFGMILHWINANCVLAILTFIVWNFIDSPVTGAILLLHASITWMKLISYVHANEDYRGNAETSATTLAMVSDLDPGMGDIVYSYPQNVTLKDIFYFWFAPTLTYQIAFPKYPNVRLWKVADILVRMVLCLTAFTFLVAQVVTPALQNLVRDLEATNGTITASILGEYWLRLCITNTYLWLLMFYFYFHLYLNLFAEILRFGDRVFYRDWWNSSEVSAYWRLWNTPVHYWLIRHLYFPCLRHGMGKLASTFVVFFISAIMHELLVSVPFHMIRPWSFIGMMMQVPLVAITKFISGKYPGTSVGNVIFWISFCVVGQPMAILFYTIDYQYGKHHDSSSVELFDQDACRIMWRSHCIVK